MGDKKPRALAHLKITIAGDDGKAVVLCEKYGHTTCLHDEGEADFKQRAIAVLKGLRNSVQPPSFRLPKEEFRDAIGVAIKEIEDLRIRGELDQ